MSSHNSAAILKPAVDSTFAIEEFLAVEQGKDLLRFSTAGSVDDGKSTLIGRLLYDSRNVYEDQVRAVTGTTTAPGQQQPSIDFAAASRALTTATGPPVPIAAT